MLRVEISTVDPGIVFLMIWFITGPDNAETLLFANEVPAIKVGALISAEMREHVLE